MAVPESDAPTLPLLGTLTGVEPPGVVADLDPIDGGIPLKRWARAMLIAVVALLLGALAALLFGVLD
jgi:hypothetical protein